MVSREKSLSHGKHASASYVEQLEPVSNAQSGVLKMLTATQLRGLRPHESLILAVLCDLDWRRINPDCSDDDASLFERFSTQHSLSLFDLQTLLSTLFPYVDNNIQQCGSAFSTLNYSYFTSANRTRFGNTSLVCMCDNESYALT